MNRQLKNTVAILAAILLGAVNLLAAQESSLTQWVNPLIGTDPNPFTKYGYGWDTGNVFPGAVCPRGMLAWSPDTPHQNVIAGGYWYPDRTIEGFSLTHFSGRGVPCLREIPFMPVIQQVDVSPGKKWSQYTASFSHTNETASPGYYQVTLDNGIKTELTSTPRTGMARFTFPAQSTVALLIRPDGSVSINGNEVTGSHVGKIAGGDHPYTIYFAAQFDRPFQSAKTWSGDAVSDAPEAEDKKCGAILTFDTATNPVVQVRAGISYVSIENAKANLAAENQGWDFAAVRQKADAAWNTVLNRIQVEGGTDAQKRSFYTALYHCFMHPNLLEDVDGRYPGMDGQIHSVDAGRHQYQNIPAWDQHRSLSPLIAILTPKESSDVIQSLLNYAQQDASVRTNGGGLPRWEQVNRNSGGMVGDGDDTVISSSFAFGVGHFDTAAALAAMDRDATQPDVTSDGDKVRSGLKEYMSLGYVPGDASITLEYCNDDFALAQFAKALGDREKFTAYQNRSLNWKKLYDDSTGFIRPLTETGAWKSDNISKSTTNGFIEGTAEQYVWMVNFDLHALIDKMGGDQKAIERLDAFFSNVNSGPNGGMAWMGNEPSEETPWIYDFAGDPAGTQKVVRRIQTQLFTDQPSGIPGNDDAGALSSWYVFSALGLYPEIPGVAGFVVGSPLFPKATIHLDNGSTIQILGENAAPENPYVQSLKLNGKSYESPWIPWSALSRGAVLDFKLGDQPSSWGSGHPIPNFTTVEP
ncbi:MAG TPA: GH92 family glycosyl hydrolase [Candidatus Methylacidiphilales bacterium]|jgi:predicted alpha-1,2-mannosidase|nr:GH92 family glycosyl hydrolase [Candidatus Methylacidiphilales bacterium]